MGLLLLSHIDLPTFLAASVVVDAEPILVLALDLDYPLHGFFHSFVGGTPFALVLAAAMSKARESISPLVSFFKLERKASFRSIMLASLSGEYIHIFLDSQVHRDIRPFYPLNYSPFLSQAALPRLWVNSLCVWCFIGAAAIYVLRLFLIWRKQS